MLRFSCCTAVAVLSLVVGCAPPRQVSPPKALNATPLPEGGDDGGEGEGKTGEATPAALALSVQFREPGQHVILNVQAGDTLGQHPNTVAANADVPQPFSLDDGASENALTASAHLDVDVAASSITAHASASFSADQEAYVVGQAGELPLTVCASGDASIARVKIQLVCDGTLDVTGNGIAAVSATSGSGASTQAWCNFMNLDGDESLIPFTSPTTVTQLIDANNGQACWDLDVYAGANTGDHAAGSGSADATFTFTASDASDASP